MFAGCKIRHISGTSENLSTFCDVITAAGQLLIQPQFSLIAQPQFKQIQHKNMITEALEDRCEDFP